MRTEIQIAGFGGQGIVLTGLLLGKAAALYDGKQAVFTQSYGPEARGGASCANVVISDAPIDFPLVTRPDILVCMFQEAYAKFRPGLKKGGTLILDSGLVRPSPMDASAPSIFATRLAEELGKKIVANVVMFGYLVGLTRAVSFAAAEKAIASTVKAKTVTLNLKAFALGLDQVRSKAAR
ncbi:MAG: hypothetical protein A3G41_00490 [Elusimicrobia bacterium RIFCSPLOWO2_12_FULL_59_9]|nr:MAG: hypothetical protein A3G41_00490 [Elusimicrobia bacterium RIFCSPLOWO2_12_FULL_59_9]